MKSEHLADSSRLSFSFGKCLSAFSLILLFIAAIVFIGCNTTKGSKEDYFGYNNNPNKEVSNQEPGARNQVSYDSGKEDEWKNPLSDDYISSGQVNDGDSEKSDSEKSDSEKKQIVNYYFYNTYPHYVPVSIPWWWGGIGWYRFSFPRIYLYVGTPVYWWDYYWYDWYAPWYNYHPYYGSRWVYYPDYWDWHYYHHRHLYWDWDYYQNRHYPYNNDVREYKKRSVRKFGPSRNINVADNDINISGSRTISDGNKETSRTNRVVGSNSGIVKDLKPVKKDFTDNDNVSFDRSSDVFKTSVAITGENPLSKDIALEKIRTRVGEKMKNVQAENLPIKGPGSVFKEVSNSGINVNNDISLSGFSEKSRNSKIESSDKKVESFRYNVQKERILEKAPSYIDYSNFNKPVEKSRNREADERERKVEKKSSESGFLKSMESVFKAFGSSSSSNRNSSSESSRSRSGSSSNESSRSFGSYSSPSSSGSSGSTHSSGSGSSGSSNSSSGERSRRAR